MAVGAEKGEVGGNANVAGTKGGYLLAASEAFEAVEGKRGTNNVAVAADFIL